MIDKNTKIIAMVLVAVFAVFIMIVGASTVMKNKDEVSDVTVSDTQAPPTVSVVATEPSTTQPEQTTTAASTTAVPELKDLILGRWTDSANMSGYEFFADGTVEMTYVNLTIPVINIPINGVSKGTYVLEGDKLTTKFSIYSATIENSYTVSVVNNSLSMKNRDGGETSTYAKASSSSAQTVTTTDAAGVVLSDEKAGSWINADSSVRYKFNSDSTAEVSFTNGNDPSISTSVLNGTYTGIYLTDGSSIIIQFTVNGTKVTQKFNFTVSKNTLSLTDETGSTDIYIREGTGFVSVGGSDLIGKWTDGVNMSGYEFKEGGVVEITYVNFTVPVVNIPINGTFTGSYSISGNKITISYLIYGSSVVETYEYTIAANSLTLKSSDGNISTYIKK